MNKKNDKPKVISVLALSLSVGGAERVISLLLENLNKDFTVYLVLFEDILFYEIPDSVNVIVLSSKKNGIFNKIFGFFSKVYRYHLFLKKNKIDVSISFLTRPNLLNSIQKFFNKKVKIILSERCYPSKAYKSNFFRYHLYKLLFPIFYNKADLIFSNSRFINEDLRNNFKIKIPLKTIYNPVRVSSISDGFKNRTLDPNYKIIFIGKLAPIKNPMLLLSAFAKLDRDVSITFLGDGVLKKQLIEKSFQLEVSERVLFTGNVKNVNPFLIESDLFVLTSNSEGFPNVLLEAMASHLTVISTNCLSGPLEILNDGVDVDIEDGEFFVAKYGILINLDDEIALIKAINFVLNDISFSKEMSEKSYQRSKDFAVEKIYLDFKSLICNV